MTDSQHKSEPDKIQPTGDRSEKKAHLPLCQVHPSKGKSQSQASHFPGEMG